MEGCSLLAHFFACALSSFCAGKKGQAVNSQQNQRMLSASADEDNRAKSAHWFLHRLSHYLTTPMPSFFNIQRHCQTKLEWQIRYAGASFSQWKSPVLNLKQEAIILDCANFNISRFPN